MQTLSEDLGTPKGKGGSMLHFVYGHPREDGRVSLCQAERCASPATTDREGLQTGGCDSLSLRETAGGRANRKRLPRHRGCRVTRLQYANIATTRGGASGVGSGMRLNLAELREAKRTLKQNNVKGVKSEDGLYVVTVHPNAMNDLEADTNILNILQYSTQPKRNEELFGPSYKDLPFGFRLFETTNVRIFAAAGLSLADVHSTTVFGDDAYAVIDFEAFPPQIIRKARGSGGATGDPLDQIASCGWKASHTAVILDQARMVNIEHSSSATAFG